MLNKNEFWNKYKSCEIYQVNQLPIEIQESIKLAKKEQQTAYTPYYKYAVAALLVTKDNSQVPGVNSETCNGHGSCAEASAICAWTRTKRSEIEFVVVVGNPLENGNSRESVFVSPCGACRQKLYEHCKDETIIVCVNETVTEARICKLSDLLPFAYTPQNLG